MADPAALPLLAFARAIQAAQSYRELFEITLAEVRRVAGYNTIWFAWIDPEDPSLLRILDIVGAARDAILDDAQRVPVAGDAMIAEVFVGARIVVVEDARSDPRTNKDVVAALGNRTIVSIPLAVADKPFAALGMGSFGEEGVRPPTPAALRRLGELASFVSVAKGRLLLREQERAAQRRQRELERRLAHVQRLDSLGVLAGGIAHDFNNLLTVISAAASMAHAARSPEELERELALIASAVARGQALTRQLLAMSRDQTLRLEEVDVAAALDALVPLLRRVIPEAITIELRTRAQHALVQADRTQLDQVIMNLCLNARDAMPRGGRLVIDVTVVEGGGVPRAPYPWARHDRALRVSVSDSGHGIAPEHIEQIFDPFFSTKSAQQGTGLGLTVAYGIVKQHGGMLLCQSEVDVGTTFEVYLPVCEPEKLVEDPAAAPAD